jgi:hypothetical protein
VLVSAIGTVSLTVCCWPGLQRLPLRSTSDLSKNHPASPSMQAGGAHAGMQCSPAGPVWGARHVCMLRNQDG